MQPDILRVGLGKTAWTLNREAQQDAEDWETSVKEV